MLEQLNSADIPNVAPPAVELPTTEVAPKQQPAKKNRTTRVFLCAITLMTLFYLDTSALRFFNVSEGAYGIFWPRHNWLYFHIIAGMTAILIGPLQFWPGLKQTYPGLHRFMGIFYVAGAGIGGVTACNLAFHTDFGWMFSMGLGSMAIAWMMSTGLATVSICRQMIEQHREWMIRSYVLTFGFVLLRVTTGVLDIANVGSIPERYIFSSWISWSVPLMITEALLQGRKVFARRQKQEIPIAAPPFAALDAASGSD